MIRPTLHQGNPWAVVLAAGDGSRLRQFTMDRFGAAVPKQYCSLIGGPSLLEMALERAATVVSKRRITTIVAAKHQRFWARPLSDFDPENVIVQPRNRGTAVGILLPLLTILRRDPFARIVFLPSDHYVEDEGVIADSMQDALNRCSGNDIYLLGIAPDHADPQLGYLVPDSDSDGHSASVIRFAEKPDYDTAVRLIEKGSVWNSFIFVADGRALLRLIERRVPDVVRAMSAALTRDTRQQGATSEVEVLYSYLPNLDFSSGILEGSEDLLRVVTVPNCGWSDLGTPERVARCIGEGNRLPASRPASQPFSIHLPLADAPANAAFAK